MADCTGQRKIFALENLIETVSRCIRDCQSFLEPKWESVSMNDSSCVSLLAV